MVLLGHTCKELRNLDYDKIPLQKVQFLLIAFDGNGLFKLPLVLSITYRALQMQGMDRKYNGHTWCKVITTNIKKNLGLALGRFIAWVTCVVCEMTMKTLCNLALVMKSFGAMSTHIF
jgi:hypothetical protein